MIIPLTGIEKASTKRLPSHRHEANCQSSPCMGTHLQIPKKVPYYHQGLAYLRYGIWQCSPVSTERMGSPIGRLGERAVYAGGCRWYRHLMNARRFFGEVDPSIELRLIISISIADCRDCLRPIEPSEDWPMIASIYCGLENKDASCLAVRTSCLMYA